MQRREFGRYRIWLPVKIDSGELQDALAVSHNLSQGGMLIAVSAKLELNADVTITFKLPASGEDRRLEGRIVRIEPNAEDPEGMWPYRVAIMFDEMAPELVPAFEEVAARDSAPPG